MVKNLTRVASLVIDWDVTGEARVAVDAPVLGAVLGAEIVICEITAEDETAGVETDADSDAGEGTVTGVEEETGFDTVVPEEDTDPDAEVELGETPEVDTGTANGEYGNVVNGSVLVAPALTTTF